MTRGERPCRLSAKVKPAPASSFATCAKGPVSVFDAKNLLSIRISDRRHSFCLTTGSAIALSGGFRLMPNLSCR
jgi:hypothetical protein